MWSASEYGQFKNIVIWKKSQKRKKLIQPGPRQGRSPLPNFPQYSPLLYQNHLICGKLSFLRAKFHPGHFPQMLPFQVQDAIEYSMIWFFLLLPYMHLPCILHGYGSLKNERCFNWLLSNYDICAEHCRIGLLFKKKHWRCDGTHQTLSHGIYIR